MAFVEKRPARFSGKVETAPERLVANVIKRVPPGAE